MGSNASNVIFLSRAVRLVGEICLFIWLIVGGIVVLSDPGFRSRSGQELIEMIQPICVLYLRAGRNPDSDGGADQNRAALAWNDCPAHQHLGPVQAGASPPAVDRPLFQRAAGGRDDGANCLALLSVPCVYAWEDLVEMNRTRGRRPKRVRIVESDALAEPPPPPPPPLPPPAPPADGAAAGHQHSRPRLRRDEPPASQTPWS